MKNLMTRKFVFGLLMAFVLALGVQGVADAFTITKTQTNPTINSTTSATVTFRVTFTQAEVDAHSGARDSTTNAIIEDNAKTYDIRLSVSPAVGVTNMVGAAPSGTTGAGVYSNNILTWMSDPTAAGNAEYSATITYTSTARGKYTFSANGRQVFVNYRVPVTD